MRRPIAVLALIVFAASPVMAQQRLEAPQSTTTITLGNERTIPIRLTNPLGEPDMFVLTVETSPVELLSATFTVGRNETGDRQRVRVRMAPGETRVVNLAVTASSCYADSCSGTVTVRGRSLETASQFVTSAEILVKRSTAVHGAPGLTWPHVLVILVVAGGATLLW